MTRLCSTKLYTRNYLKSDDYISHIINRNKNSTYNLMNNTNNTSNTNYYYDENERIFKKNKNKSFHGFDMRENITDNISLYNISVFFYKKGLLDLLNNDNVCINKKISHIDEYNKLFGEDKCYNIYAGGLMKDWDFQF
jgi:hypothetical protein